MFIADTKFTYHTVVKPHLILIVFSFLIVLTLSGFNNSQTFNNSKLCHQGTSLGDHSTDLPIALLPGFSLRIFTDERQRI